MANHTAPVIERPTAVDEDGPIYVVATRPGTYPRPGDTYGIYRDLGSTFVLNDPAHFSDSAVGGWMRRIAPGEVPVVEAPRPVPQTAQRIGPATAISNPFPHLG